VSQPLDEDGRWLDEEDGRVGATVSSCASPAVMAAASSAPSARRAESRVETSRRAASRANHFERLYPRVIITVMFGGLLDS